jgi:hypothetical protein
MVKDERRRYPRFRTTLSVAVKERQGEARLLTADVSRKGAYIITDSPWPERELVHLRFMLPDGEPVELMGMVSRCVESDGTGDGSQGMGIDFFALSEEAKERWDEFIEDLPERSCEEADGEGKVPPTRRKHRRFVSRFLVRLKDKERLREFYTRDISTGGMFLRTPVPEQVSPVVEVVLVHPQSEEEFSLTGRVVRVVDGPALADRGVALEFDPLLEEDEASLLTFIETGVNYLRRVDSDHTERVLMILRALEAMLDSPDALVKLGEVLLQDVEPEAAARAFRSALEVNPHCLAAHRGLYKVHVMLGDPEKARRHLEALRRLEPGQSSTEPTRPS